MRRVFSDARTKIKFGVLRKAIHSAVYFNENIGIYQAQGHHQLPLREGPPEPSLPWGARLEEVSFWRGAVYRMQALRGHLPGSGECDHPSTGSLLKLPATGLVISKWIESLGAECSYYVENGKPWLLLTSVSQKKVWFLLEEAPIF